MTRINLIPVEELTDQHLMAEYRELPMIAKSLFKTLHSKCGYSECKVPSKYVLGIGHIYFFYNKRDYLVGRYLKLISELKLRKFDINPDNRNMSWEIFDRITQIEWTPTNEDIALNKARIDERVSLKPNWYRKTTYDSSTTN